jgi:hypothetical protein
VQNKIITDLYEVAAGTMQTLSDVFYSAFLHYNTTGKIPLTYHILLLHLLPLHVCGCTVYCNRKNKKGKGNLTAKEKQDRIRNKQDGVMMLFAQQIFL